MFVAALIVLIVAVLLVIAALFGGGDATTSTWARSTSRPASMVFFAGMGTLLLFVLSLGMFRSAAKRAAARRADRKRVSELSSKLDEYKREEREAGRTATSPDRRRADVTVRR